MELELWKKWEQFPLILVSNYGKIRNAKTGKFYTLRKDSWSDLLYVQFHYNAKLIKIEVGKLILSLFERSPLDGENVRYIDGNFDNLNIKNLSWTTKKRKFFKNETQIFKTNFVNIIEQYAQYVEPLDTHTNLGKKLGLSRTSIYFNLRLLKKNLNISGKRYYIYSIIHSWLASKKGETIFLDKRCGPNCKCTKCNIRNKLFNPLPFVSSDEILEIYKKFVLEL